MQYLQANLRLNADNDPLPDTFLRAGLWWNYLRLLMIMRYFLIRMWMTGSDYSVTLDRPGVIMFIRLEFPRTYTVLQPITWTIKSSAEMVF